MKHHHKNCQRTKSLQTTLSSICVLLNLESIISILEKDLLIEKCKKGNEKAQNLLYQQFARAMFGLCFRYTASEQDAEEILMNGFLKVFKHIPAFENRHEGSLAAWIKKIMVNEALNFLRSQKNFLFVEANEQNSGLDEEENALEQLESAELYQLIQAMPIGYRTIFNLYVVEGFTHQEIAEQLRISSNTSKTQLRKARLWLQAQLKKNESLI